MDAIIVSNTQTALQVPTASRLVQVFLSGKSGRTLRAYSLDLQDFSDFVGADTVDQAASALMGRGHGGANELALAWRSDLLERGLSPATVNRRLAALRSLVKLGRTLGLVPWTLELPGVQGQAYRDTRGPGRDGFRRLLDQTDNSAKGRRDRLILRLLWDLALRREEVVSLDLEHADQDAGTVSILGKGRRERETLTLPAATRDALRDWLAARGDEPGPLVYNVDRRTRGRRLTGAGLYHVVRTLGKGAGIKVRPHGIRHAAITEALEVTQGNVRAVQRFSRHRDVRTLSTYDDNRQDLGGNVAALVAASA